MNDRTQKVVVNGYIVVLGMWYLGLHKDSLRPIIVSLLHQWLHWLIKSSVKLYADDVILYRVIDNAADHEILQQDLIALSKWANTWQMTFKYELLHITNKKNLLEYLNGENVRNVPHTKYLGVILDENLTFNEHIKKSKSSQVFLTTKHQLLFN